jgi:hypothetical protein
MAEDGRQPERAVGGMEFLMGVGTRKLDPSDYKLRDCPFCGSVPLMCRYPPLGIGIWIDRPDGTKYFLPPDPAKTVIHCSECEITFRDIETLDVVDHWNGRRLKTVEA